MSEEKAKLSGPDLTQGVELSTVPDGTMLLGHAHGEPVLLARRGDELFAIGAICTHYGAPLEQGLLVGDTVRCPWHHACFSLRTGEALRAPALNPVSRWRVEEVRDLARQFTPVETRVGAVYVREKLERAAPTSAAEQRPARRDPSLSSVAARPAMPLRKRFVARATPAASRCSAPMRRCPAIGPTYRRAISPAPRPTSRISSGRQNSIKTTKSTCAWAHAWPRST